jgi:hypothetical protein
MTKHKNRINRSPLLQAIAFDAARLLRSAADNDLILDDVCRRLSNPLNPHPLAEYPMLVSQILKACADSLEETIKS